MHAVGPDKHSHNYLKQLFYPCKSNETYICSWSLGTYKLFLYLKNNKPNCAVTDLKTRRFKNVEILSEDLDIVNTVDLLKKRLPSIPPSGILNFLEVQTIADFPSTKPGDDYDVEIIEAEEELYVKFFYPCCNVNIIEKADNVSYSNDGPLNRESKNNLINLDQAFRRLDRSQWNNFGSNLEYRVDHHQYYFSTFTIPSIYSKREVISKDQCALTLINSGDTWYGHAAIILESLENGCRLIRKCHIRADKDIMNDSIVPAIIENKPAKKLPTDKGTSMTWVRPRSLVDKMLREIEWEEKCCREGAPEVFFNMKGKSAVNVQPIVLNEFNYEPYAASYDKRYKKVGDKWQKVAEVHNCITWAIEKLQIAEVDISLPKWPRSFISPIEYIDYTTAYPHPGKHNACTIQ